jgi:hypothetical protein
MYGMQLAKKIRESLGLSCWGMKKRLNKKSIQAYLYLERESRAVKIADLIALQELSGMTLDRFWSELKKEAALEQPAAKVKRARRKK